MLGMDASVDAPAAIQFISGCDESVITSLTLPDIRVGQSFSDSLRFIMQGWYASATSSDPELAVHLSDPVLGKVGFTFTPSSPGPRDITVTVTNWNKGNPDNITGTLRIVVNVLPASTAPLVIGSPLVKMDPYTQTGGVTLKNQSTSTAIDLFDSTITFDDGSPPIGVNQLRGCPRTLLPGDTCGGTLDVGAMTLGCRRGTATVHGSANDVTFYLDTARGLATVDLTSPLGTVTSDPPGACTASQCSVTPVQLTATPNAGARFVGWTLDSGCGTDPTCAFRPYSQRLANTTWGAIARFAPSTAPTVDLTITGGGRGRVLFFEDDGTAVACDGSCTYASTGGLRLVAPSGSKFTGWSGACTGAVQECDLGTLTGNVAVTATFDADDREVATLAPPAFVLYTNNGGTAGGALPGGDWVIATASMISRMTTAGTVVWSQPGAVSDLVTTAAGDIYDLTPMPCTPILTKRDAGGNVQWSRAILQPPDIYPCPSRLAITGTGDIAIASAETVRVVSSATGEDVWTVAVPGWIRIASDPAGNVVVSVLDSVDPAITRLQRYDATGTRVMPDWTIGTGDPFDMSFDAQGLLVVWANLAGGPTLVRLDPTGAVVLSAPTGNIGAFAIAPSGDIVTADVNDTGTGMRFRRWSPTGVVTWTVNKPLFLSPSGWIGVVTYSVNTDASGRALVIGRQRLVETVQSEVAVPWAAVYSP
jgi:hypothetical protein